MLEDFEGRPELRDPALVHDRYPGSEAQRFLDIVGHEHDRLYRFPVNAREFGLQGVPGDRVDRGERLIHQQ